MTNEERAKLRAAAEAATPGPWMVDPRYKCDVQSCGGALELLTTSQDVLPKGMKPSRPFQFANAAYIAAAHPKTTLALLDEIDRLHNEVDRLRDSAGRPPTFRGQVFRSGGQVQQYADVHIDVVNCQPRLAMPRVPDAVTVMAPDRARSIGQCLIQAADTAERGLDPNREAP